ncbi:hypothetical protein [Nocardioides sp. LS1]|uniref:hypothetical protein n=1 Tax=Nocardioides sp. LS1 TaxID=1027620 RepID=UPI000F61D644|nr:hypothetical protein [Nocardioides sp. LS1]GCD91618.1 hypothetical protein NLS1_36240 [Nocardioides sp. LS1]
MRPVPGPRTVARRVVAGIGLDEVIHLQRRVDELAVAVAENAALAVPLAAKVTELEQALVGPLQQRRRFRDEHGLDAS